MQAFSTDQTENAGQFHQDLENVFNNKELSDFQIQCGERTFDCHQVILYARSSVFRAMFQAEMLEKKTKKMHLSHFDRDVLEQMLLFIYTGKISKIEELAGELLAAAHQYQLQMLKTICEESLSNRLKVPSSLSGETCIMQTISRVSVSSSLSVTQEASPHPKTEWFCSD